MSTKKNAAYNVAYRMFSVFLPLVTAPYLSRTVGTDGVGLYSLAWSVSYVFCLIGMLGLNDYGVRTIAQVRDNREELDRTFSAIWQMQLLVAGATLVAWLGYVFLVAGEEKVIALHLTMMSVSCLVSLDWCLMGLDIFKPIALRNTFVKLAAAACVFLFVKKKEDLWIYGFVWSLATLIGNLMSAASLRGKVTYRPVPIRESLKHLKPCAVLFISVLAVNVYRTMDKVMVSAIAGVHENGLYENAEKIIYCLSGFISAIGTVMMPKVAHMQKEGATEKIARHIDRSMELMLCMTSAMAFGVAAVADVFAPLFYGEDFRYSGTLMAPFRERDPDPGGAAPKAGSHLCEERVLRGGGEPDRQRLPDSFDEEHGRGGGHADGGDDSAGGAVHNSAEGAALRAVPEIRRNLRGVRGHHAGVRTAGENAGTGGDMALPRDHDGGRHRGLCGAVHRLLEDDEEELPGAEPVTENRTFAWGS